MEYSVKTIARRRGRLVGFGRYLAPCLVLCLAWAAGGHCEIVDGVAVKVNEEIISISEIEEALAAYRQSGDDREVTQQMVIDKLVEKALVVQEARRQHITASPDDVDAQADSELALLAKRLGGDDGLKRQLARENITREELRQQYRQRVKRQMMYMRMMHKKEQEFRDQVTISEGEVEEFLEQHGNDYRSADVSVISFPLPRGARGPKKDRLETKARGVLAKLRSGGEFAVLAAKNDPLARENGGYIGRVSYAELPKELAELVFSIGKREQGKTVFRSSKAGFFILRVSDKEEATVENSGDHARARLISEKAEGKFAAWHKGLIAKAYVKIMKW
jgi:peptidyl-prolyl cis-trans isomerase SurA